MNVRSSTRATSLGSDSARKLPGRLAGFSRRNVPAATSSSHKPVVLLLRAVTPHDPVRLGQARDVGYPGVQLPVLDVRRGGGRSAKALRSLPASNRSLRRSRYALVVAMWQTAGRPILAGAYRPCGIAGSASPARDAPKNRPAPRAREEVSWS